MLKNVLLEVEYLGTNYFGFQIQRGKEHLPTVQAKLEEALEKLFKCKIKINYASRTDRGVHANMQLVNFLIDTKIPLKNIKNALNTSLPKDIYIKKIKCVPLDFHARYNILYKIYRYFIRNSKNFSVFHKDFCWHISQVLDVERMRKAKEYIVGKRDFSLFAKSYKSYKNKVRNIEKIDIKKRDSFIIIDVYGQSFMRGMVRNIVRFLVDVGLHRVDIEDVPNIIEGRKNYHLRIPAPPQGLFLYRIYY